MSTKEEREETPFGRVTKDGLTPLPKAWTRRVDEDYAEFLRGKRHHQVRCHFKLADGTEYDGPCQLVRGEVVQVRGNEQTRGFGF